MKKFKKVFAVILSLAMVLGMGMTAFADGPIVAPSSSDKRTITIKGIDSAESPTFKVYKIVEPQYEIGVGLTGYKVVDGYSISDTTNFKPAVNEIAGLVTASKNKTAENFVFTPNGNGDYVTGQVAGAGEYLVIVESAGYTYNPMVVSVAYSNANSEASLGNGEVDASSGWELESGVAYIKSSKINLDKKADVSTQEVSGDVSYEITGKIPSYGPDYMNPVYKITDTYTNLANVTEPQVFIGTNKTTPVQAGDDTYTYQATANGFVIIFNNIKKRAADSAADRDVLIKYSGKIAESAKVNDPATNSAVLDYTHKPGEDTSGDPVTTHTYTFDIDNYFVKTGENDVPLADSVFTLYKSGSDEAYKTCTTAVDNGKASIHFEGLNEGTYTMKETVATDDYSINDTVYTIVIDSLTYDSNSNNKKLTGYKVKITGSEKTNPTNQEYTYTWNEAEKKFVASNSAVTTVQNTKLSSLPSTGGIGTTIFTIGGCAIMIVAAGLFFASRRRSAK